MYRHRQFLRVAATVVSTALVLLCMTVGAHGQDSAIIKGINYTVGAQDPSGLWNVGGQTEFRDASAALRILSKLGGDSAAIANGSAALEMQLVASSDYLARQLLALTASGTNSDLDNLANTLIGNQNLDGGWGYGLHYGKNVLETALAMRALMEAQSDSMSSVGAGVSGLLSQQNPDGGFGFAQGDSSRVYYTAQAALALKLVENLFSVSTQLQNAVDWLIAQANPDGGFGTGGTSNPYETGLALAAIAQVNPLSSAVGNAMTYLTSSQMPDGSWGGDVYSTAIAIEGLFNVGPDIAVPNAFINFAPAAPVDSDQVTISATIRNDGVTAVNNVVVQFFDGHPDSGGVQIGADHTITTIAGGSQSVVQQSWDTFGLGGDHSIYVIADPLDLIVEPLEFNNISSRNVHVSLPPDLYIDGDGIAFDPPAPGVDDQLLIAVVIKNVGEVEATNVEVELFIGHPDSGGTSFFSFGISLIPAGGEAPVDLNMGNFFTEEAWHEIWVCTDLPNYIRESNEENNCQSRDLIVGPQVVARSLPYCTGLNLMALPVVLHDPLKPLLEMTTFSLMPEISGATEMNYWDRPGQRWLQAAAIPGGGIVGEDHDLGTVDGFFARVTGPGTLDITGIVPPVHQCTDLEQGLNIIGVPDQAACYTAYSLLEDLPDGQEAHR
ncbi:MAG: CARDB domain-containing protein, partial [Candidatus Zixiibacteriota bacterium]